MVLEGKTKNGNTLFITYEEEARGTLPKGQLVVGLLHGGRGFGGATLLKTILNEEAALAKAPPDPNRAYLGEDGGIWVFQSTEPEIENG